MPLRRSTKETNKKRAEKIAALKLSQALGETGLLDRRAPRLNQRPWHALFVAQSRS